MSSKESGATPADDGPSASTPLDASADLSFGRDRPRFKDAPTFGAYMATQFAGWVLLATCGSVLLLLGYWLWGACSPEEAQRLAAAFGGGASEQQARAAELWKALRMEHASTASEVAKVLIAGVLLPILTLLLGYAFGSREREERAG
jgi:hypothetical protein